MTSLPLQIALTLTGQIIPVPGQHADAPRPTDSTDPGYFELLEQNSHIIYPALGLLVLVIIGAGILQAWRTQDLDGLAKAELKREVILELRKQLGGVTAESLARKLGMEPFRMVGILEEMQKDGLLLSHTNTQRLTVWRVKGVGPTNGSRRRTSRG